MTEAFYEIDGDRFVPTEWTRGPWDPLAQHAGPPAALVGRAIEALEPTELRPARLTMEILRPIPLSPLAVRADVVRQGRRVQFAQATVAAGDVEVARASAWRIRPSPEPLPAAGLEARRFPGPQAADESPPFDPWGGPSYFMAMEWRYVRGSFAEAGPGTAWMRMRVLLIAGEEPSPLTRVLVAADSGNGISGALPIERYLFINTELSVHLFRRPVGPWVCLEAISRIDPSGLALAESNLWDEDGRIGRSDQSLLVAPR